jgi:predicted NUDIX family NTP pyrophosphohydrolase
MQSFGFVIIKIVFKVVYIWVLEKDINVDAIVSNIFEIEWPPTATTTELGIRLNGKLVLYLG